ncbi:TerC family protein [Silicimonas algicola]|uniref:YjbE family integral membrane protein n=1 Tax=Silicimonas algicola TaxID=1826607 RepID=A0A316G7N7_9RHOB|nr:YjbE family putative metal transport protein [Silicimonas algicola]AZQ67310.1 TerC family protein [Silicimonas algicola]PWK56989.1 YjbE family integral membrane protein [Silicimonas algicola]
MIEMLLDSGKIVVADLILSGDNALIIGMAAASLSPDLRKKAILYGMVMAAGLRILFAVVATSLLDVKGLLFIGSLLLLWVCWRLFVEIRAGTEDAAADSMGAADDPQSGYTGAPRRSLRQALLSIAVADVSMSLDNVLAVAAIADGDEIMLILGLGLAILLMAFAATLIMKLLTRFPWISWLGLAVLLYVAFEMLYRGTVDQTLGVGPMLGLMEGWPTGKH